LGATHFEKDCSWDFVNAINSIEEPKAKPKDPQQFAIIAPSMDVNQQTA
jgi:hypothetical protein